MKLILVIHEIKSMLFWTSESNENFYLIPWKTKMNKKHTRSYCFYFSLLPRRFLQNPGGFAILSVKSIGNLWLGLFENLAFSYSFFYCYQWQLTAPVGIMHHRGPGCFMKFLIRIFKISCPYGLFKS
jgi:hypothetical protein